MIGDMIKKRCPECGLTAFIVPSMTLTREAHPGGFAQCRQGHSFRFEHGDMFQTADEDLYGPVDIEKLDRDLHGG